MEKEILISKFKTLKTLLTRPEKLEALDNILELIEKDDYYSAAVVIEEKLYREHYMRSIKKVKPDLVIYNEDMGKSVEIINNFVNEKLKKCGIIR